MSMSSVPWIRSFFVMFVPSTFDGSDVPIERQGETRCIFQPKSLPAGHARAGNAGEPVLICEANGFREAYASMLSEVVYSMRQLRKAPGFAAVAVLTLAFGIGANTAVFSVVNAALLRRLPYPQSERIVELWSKTRDSSAVPHVTGPQLKHWREYNTVFTDVAGIWDRYTTNLLGRERAERIVCALVSANYLDVLGVHPLFGRNFAPNADVEGSD